MSVGSERGAVHTWESAEAAERWRQNTARRAQYLGEVTEQMLDAARLEPGCRVLDLAAGAGDQSVLAARRVGPEGTVLAVDISASMLAAAEDAAREAGVSNISTLVCDIAQLEVDTESFDAAISRFGLMFVAELAEALARINRALKPGARFAALVWSAEERNPYMSSAVYIVRQMGRLPSPTPTVVRAMSLGVPGVFEHALAEAQFNDVSVRPVALVRRFNSVEESLEQMRTASSALEELSRELSESEKKHLEAELRKRLASFAAADGTLTTRSEALLGVGTR